jgi:hypothetical protein
VACKDLTSLLNRRHGFGTRRSMAFGTLSRSPNVVSNSVRARAIALTFVSVTYGRFQIASKALCGQRLLVVPMARTLFSSSLSWLGTMTERVISSLPIAKVAEAKLGKTKRMQEAGELSGHAATNGMERGHRSPRTRFERRTYPMVIAAVAPALVSNPCNAS